MAKKKKKEVENGTEKKGGGSKIILIIVGVIILFVVVAGAVFIGYMAATKHLGIAANTITESTEEKGKKVTETTYKLDEFLVNLKDENKSKYLKISVSLGADEKNTDLKTEITAYTPQMRDRVVQILRSKLSTDFTNDGIQSLKSEIMSSVNEVLTKGQIIDVYITDIQIQ